MCSPEDLATLTAALNEAAATLLCDKLGAQSDRSSAIEKGVNAQFLIWAGALVFIMHAGFAMLCAGSIRSKNTLNILLQTILDAAVSALAFYVLGYGFAYGYGDEANVARSDGAIASLSPTASGRFIGDNLFGLYRFVTLDGRWESFFYQWAFAATATTIPAGSVAERFNFNAYLGYSAFISAWVYPVVVHWAWSSTGWMGAFKTVHKLWHIGYIDFAGSGVVHMVGGFSGLVGAVLVGPRMGRFDASGAPVSMPGHSATLVVLGTTLLWFGWYGFNPGSVLAVTNGTLSTVAGRAAVCTTLCGAAGGVSALMLGFARHRAWDLIALCNGVLVGFVTITAGAHVLEPWAAIIAGMIGAWIFEFTCWLWLKLQIDDPLGASPMHGICGAWGVFFVGLLAKREYVEESYGTNTNHGLFYGGGGRLLACQVIGILVIASWVTVNMGIFFSIFKAFGKLRISSEEEHMGLDLSKHGGSAYNYDSGLQQLHAATSKGRALPTTWQSTLNPHSDPGFDNVGKAQGKGDDTAAMTIVGQNVELGNMDQGIGKRAGEL